MKRVSKLIKKARSESKYTQYSLGEYLGYIGGQFISNWERGVSIPPLELSRELCTLLDIDIKEYKKALIADYIDKVEEIV